MKAFPLLIGLFLFAAIVFSAAQPTLARGPGDPRPGNGPLEELHERMLPLFELTGVVFTDADERNGRLVVGIENRGLATVVRQRLATLGIQPDSVDIIETAAIHQLATLRDSVRPLQGGLQIHFSNYLCTLGFNAVRSGVSGFVTNSHCTTSQGSVDGTQYYQPLSSVNSTVVGNETADPAYSHSNGNCPNGRICRWSDSAFVRHANGVQATLGSIAKTTGLGSRTVSGDFTITGEGSADAGTTVNKVGRTTGWTQGAISNTCINVGVSNTNIVHLCQNLVTSGTQIVAAGDSGSPVFTIDSGDNVTLQGILWGGSTDGTMLVYSPIGSVEAELGALETASIGSGTGSPPAAPTWSGATSSSPTSVELRWDDNSNNEDGFSIARFDGTGWPVVGQVGPNATSFIDSVPAPGTYGYSVYAENADGVAGTAVPMMVITQSDPPRPPTLTSAVGISTSQVRLTWNDNSSNESGFKILRLSGSSWQPVGSAGPNETSFVDEGLEAGSVYFYWIHAFNSSGTIYSPAVALGKTFDAPADPVAPTFVEASSATGNEIQLSWEDNSEDEDRFLVARFDGSGWPVVGTAGPNTTSFTDEVPSPGTYSYWVSSEKGEDVIAAPAPIIALTLSSPPAPPTLASAFGVSTSSVKITWNDNSSNESGFKILRLSGTSWQEVATVGPNQTSFTDSGLGNGSVYLYWIHAFNADGTTYAPALILGKTQD